MDVGKLICNVSNRFYRHLGMRVQRLDPDQERVITQYGSSPEVTVRRLAWIAGQLHFQPAAILDVGASDGRWARVALQYFPAARYLLIEPLEQHQATLAALAKEHPGVACVRSLAGRASGTATFMQHGFQSSLLGTLDGAAFGQPTEMQVAAIDSLLQEQSFPAPDLIKLDIEGGELDALHGAKGALRSAQLVQLEFSLIRFKRNLPLLDEVVAFMSQQGFRIADISGVYGRPLDGLPVQGECVFMPKESSLLTDRRWSQSAAWS